jgi:hypothetical protein
VTGVEGWPIHGRAPRRITIPPAGTSEYDAAALYGDPDIGLALVLVEMSGPTSDADMLRIVDGLRRMP